MPSNNNYFPSALDYISACNYDTNNRNCIMFALGVTKADSKSSVAFNIKPLDGVNNLENLTQGFLRTVDKHTFGFSSQNFRKILSEDAELTPEETYIFKVYGFDEYRYTMFGFEMSSYDFHVMRALRAPSGELHWEHKMGWERSPGEVTSQDLEDLEEQYHDKFVYFAFTPPKS